MKIYDCFRYNGEDLLLKIRLKTLYKNVDKFVIIEGDKYYNGESKEQIFNIDKFKEFEHKIEYYFVDNFPKYDFKNNAESSWKYDDYHINQIKLGLKNLEEDDYILISDLDEIPNLSDMKFLKYDTVAFLQNMYYYKFNIHCYKGLKWNNKWPGTKGCKFQFFKSARQVREFRVKNIPKWRLDKKLNRHIVYNGGWHFSYLMDTNEIKLKLSRMPGEIDHLLKNNIDLKKKLFEDKVINEKYKNFQDIYGRKDILLKKVEIDFSFPDEIRNNLKVYSKFIA